MGKLTTVSLSVTLDCRGDAHCGGHEVRSISDGFRCPRCREETSFSPERWGDLLDPMVHELPYAAGPTELSRTIKEGRVEAATKTPSCPTCAAPISMGDVARATSAGRHVCGKCEAPMVVRAVPPSYAAALPGITHLLGEDPRFLANPEALVAVDAAAPDYTFYLVHDDAVPRSTVRGKLRWKDLWSAAGDAEGNVYGVARDVNGGHGGGTTIVFSLDPLGQTRWISREPDESDAIWDRTVAVSNRGNLLFWMPASAVALHWSSVDGKRVGTIGQAQPQGSPTHTLDMKDASYVAFDVDGSIVLQKYLWLKRCMLDGTAAPMWPPHKAFFGLMTAVSKTEPFLSPSLASPNVSASVERLEDYPAGAFGGAIHFGWEGSLYVWAGKHVASFDRAGKRRWLVTLAADVIALGGDAAGRACVLSAAGEGASIHRIAAEGIVSAVVGGNETRISLPRESLLVAGDGRMVALGKAGDACGIAADGAVLWQRERPPDVS